MPITRAKASQLLNQKEMALYDESRANGLRRLDGKAISTRITRARAARDRARDLVRRQKLSSRADTGSKRGASGAANQRSKDKAELMADILARFETGLREAKGKEAGTKSRRTTTTADTTKTAAAAKKAAKTTGAKATKKIAKSAKNPSTETVKKTATKKNATGTVRKPAAKKAATGIGKKAATKKAAATTPTKQPAKKTSNGNPESTATTSAVDTSTSTSRGDANKPERGGDKTTSSTALAKDSPTTASAPSTKANAPRSRPRKRRITPEQALAQTQALLEAKHARDQEPKPWADGVEGGVDPGTPGYQSDSAARRAKRLHAAEVRLPAIQGSASTRDRINQGKRDNRGNDD